MKTKLTLWDEADEMAYVMAIANTILAAPAIVPAIYAFIFPPILVAPLVGYGLLWGYWRRYRNHLEPRIWLWAVTIIFNAIVPVLLVINWGELENQGWFVALAVWNLAMIIGAIRALVLDARNILQDKRVRAAYGRAA